MFSGFSNQTFFWGFICTQWGLICAWDSSPHLPVTSPQLMRPGIGRNASCTVD